VIEDAGVGASIDLRVALGRDWDVLAVLGPYSDNERAAELLGFPFPFEDVSPWVNTEGGATFVVGRDSQLVGWFNMSSAAGYAFCLEGKRLTPDRTVIVDLDSHGFRVLIDPLDRACAASVTASRHGARGILGRVSEPRASPREGPPSLVMEARRPPRETDASLRSIAPPPPRRATAGDV